MKLNQAKKTFETNAEVTSQEFSIGDTSVVIEILRNKLYRHKVRTLVQEYISNARDAMREISSKERIEITVPTTFNATFKVRDFGPGISKDRMYNVFIKYASSTKRDTNKQTGGFGIGAKSAWSYTESFTIVTYIDGIKATYIAHIGSNNNGTLDFLGNEPTKERNGTEIQVPVNPKDTYDFKRAALRATYFWSESEQPTFKGLAKEDHTPRSKGQWIDTIEVNNDLPEYICSKYGSDTVVSIDGIPYVLDRELVSRISGLNKLASTITGKLVLHVKNGQLEVSASREEISDSKFSIDCLDKLGKDLYNKVISMLDKEFKKATTPFEHLSTYMKYSKSFELSKFRNYDQFQCTNNDTIQSPLFSKVKIHRCSLKSNDSVEKYNVGEASRFRIPFVGAYDFGNMYFIPKGTESIIVSNNRIRELLKLHKAVLVFSEFDTDKGEFKKCKDALGLKDLTTVNFTPVVKTRATLAIARTKQQFCVHRCDKIAYRTETTSLDANTTQWLYVERGNLKQFDLGLLRDLSLYLTQTRGLIICELGKDTISKVKDDKNFKPLNEFLNNFKPSQVDIKALKQKIKRHPDEVFKLFNVKGIKDKFLNEMIDEYKDKSETELPVILKNVLKGKVKEVDEFDEKDKKFVSLLKDKYMLLSYVDFSSKETKVLAELTDYINSK